MYASATPTRSEPRTPPDRLSDVSGDDLDRLTDSSSRQQHVESGLLSPRTLRRGLSKLDHIYLQRSSGSPVRLNIGTLQPHIPGTPQPTAADYLAHHRSEIRRHIRREGRSTTLFEPGARNPFVYHGSRANEPPAEDFNLQEDPFRTRTRGGMPLDPEREIERRSAEIRRLGHMQAERQAELREAPANREPDSSTRAVRGRDHQVSTAPRSPDRQLSNDQDDRGNFQPEAFRSAHTDAEAIESSESTSEALALKSQDTDVMDLTDFGEPLARSRDLERYEASVVTESQGRLGLPEPIIPEAPGREDELSSSQTKRGSAAHKGSDSATCSKFDQEKQKPLKLKLGKVSRKDDLTQLSDDSTALQAQVEADALMARQLQDELDRGYVADSSPRETAAVAGSSSRRDGNDSTPIGDAPLLDEELVVLARLEQERTDREMAEELARQFDANKDDGPRPYDKAPSHNIYESTESEDIVLDDWVEDVDDCFEAASPAKREKGKERATDHSSGSRLYGSNDNQRPTSYAQDADNGRGFDEASAMTEAERLAKAHYERESMKQSHPSYQRKLLERTALKREENPTLFESPLTPTRPSPSSSSSSLSSPPSTASPSLSPGSSATSENVSQQPDVAEGEMFPADLYISDDEDEAIGLPSVVVSGDSARARRMGRSHMDSNPRGRQRAPSPNMTTPDAISPTQRDGQGEQNRQQGVSRRSDEHVEKKDEDVLPSLPATPRPRAATLPGPPPGETSHESRGRRLYRPDETAALRDDTPAPPDERPVPAASAWNPMAPSGARVSSPQTTYASMRSVPEGDWTCPFTLQTQADYPSH
ncbi:hypothetical protein CAC42_4891 [Sphaceloma murrayae]|uniref:Uncharacterized protein n=1 Tax=Sphaceloma murrayae TaxID=2082308 RepID=A0A2K1QP90_9PEZI|nr:hypothetical protein CAC42_4891 [Sphaceloma murrayae]